MNLSFGQLLQWNTFGNTGTEITEPSVFNNINILSSNLTQGTIIASGNSNRFGGSNWWNSGDSSTNTLAQAVAGNDYIQFIVTPNTGFSFTPTSLDFNWDRSGSGPANVTLRSSADNFVSDTGTIIGVAALGTTNTIAISGLTNITLSTTFRIYGYGASAATGTGGFDVGSNVVNVQLNGTTTSSAITSVANGDWNVGATWVGGVVPTSVQNVIVAHNVTGGALTRDLGTTTVVNSGANLAVSGTYANNGGITVNGAFQLDAGGFASGYNFVYGAAGILNFNNTSSYGVNNSDKYWPTNSGPFNVNVLQGGFTLNTANRTIAGTLATASGVSLSTSTLTLTGTCQINQGGFFNNTPIFGSSSTLVYNNSGSIAVGLEWTGNAISAGSGIPQNVTIQNSTTVTMPNGNRGLAGNINIASGGLTLNTGGDVYVGGNWTVGTSASQTNNSKAVFFNGSSGDQTITKTGGGNVFFDYLVVDKSAGNVVVEALTNIVNNSISGNVLQIINSGSLDLNGRSLTLNGNGGNILVTGGARNISGVANSAVNINGAKTVSGTGSLVLGLNVSIVLSGGFDCGSGNNTTVNGTLQINPNGFVNNNAPIYGNASLLKYNSSSVFNRDIEWNRNIGGAFGVPNNVQISNNTTLNYPYRQEGNPPPGALGITGNLIIDAGSSLYMDYGSASCGGALTIAGNLTTAGNLTLGFAIGDDLNIGGNIIFSAGYGFDAKTRAIFFTKNGTQTISGTGTTPTFHKLLQAPTSGINTIQLVGMDLNITAPNGGNSIDFGSAANVFDINGRTLTLGTAGVANAIVGANGMFKGSTTSNLVLIGIGSLGTLRFLTGFQSLGTLNLNRQAASIGVVLGSALFINTAINLNNGLLDLSSFNLTLGSIATVGGSASINSFIIADNIGELRKTYITNGSFTFPIGDNTGTAAYSPVTLNFLSGIYSSAYAGIRVVNTKHPNNIASTDFLNRYWSVSSSGITSPNYTFTGTYVTADIVGTESNSKGGRWDGTDWLDESMTAIGSKTLTLSGISSLSSPNDFTAGAPLSNATYYYRSSVNGGSWNTALNWQSSVDGLSGWATASSPPNYKSAAIMIRNGFNINSNGTVTADDITIDTGAVLTISAGTFTLNNGTAVTDLIINGTLTYSGGTFTQNASSGTNFSANSSYNHAITASTLTLPIATWDIASNCNVTGLNNSSIISGGATIGQTFGNFTFDNSNQTTYINIENNNFRVNGTLTVGPNAITQRVSFTNTGSNSNTINRVVVSNGQLNAAGGGNETLTITNDVSVTDGLFVISGGSGTATVDIGTDLSISGNGTVQILGISSSPSQNLRIRRDLLISGASPQLNLEAVNTSISVATITVDRDFNCFSTSATIPAIDFGSATSNANNVINIARNFSKTGAGFFQTFSNSSAIGFAFNGTGSQTFSYSGANSNYTSYVIRNNATLLLNSNLTLGSGTIPPSFFTIDNGGTLNFQTNSIIAVNTTDPRFIASAGSNLITSNTNGLGGTAAVGSLRSFGSVGTALSAGKAAFVAGHNLTFNAATTTPFANANNANFGSPATINVNADLTSNMTTNIIVTTAFNVNNGGSFKLNPTNNNGLNLSGTATLNIATGGAFDNGGENSIINGGLITISGKFITQDAQGFVGSNTSIPTITPLLNAGSTIEYGLAGNQEVQGSTAPTYQNITFSNGGTKTLVSSNSVVETISILGSTIFDAGNNAFGSGTSNITMTGTSLYKLGGTTASKPESGGTYNLGANTTFEFTGSSSTNIRLSAPTIQYANIVVSGTNVFNPGTVTGIKFITNGTFTVKNGGVFKLQNTNGFTGSTSTGIDTVTNGGPTIALETGSRVEFAGDQTLPATQTITPFATYSDVGISGKATKVILTSSEILVGRDLILSPFSTASQTGNLQIDIGKLLSVTRNILNISTKDLVIKDGGNLVQITDIDNATSNANIGNINMQRTSRSMKINDYVYWGSPVQGNVIGQMPAGFDISYMWDLDGSIDGTWNPTATTIPGRGFITRADAIGTKTFNFRNVPNNGVVTYQTNSNCDCLNPTTTDLTYTGNTALVANPYPSALDAKKFLEDAANIGLGGTIFFWSASTEYTGTIYNVDDYASWNLTGGTSTALSPASNNILSLKPTGKIAAGQGFFVQTFNDANVTFNNQMRLRTTTDNGQFYRTNNNNVEATDSIAHRIWLNLTNDNGDFRQALVGYIPNATNGFDKLYDGDSFTNNSIDLYSIADTRALVIQGRALPFEDSDLVAMGIKVLNSGNYTIAIDELDGLFSGNQNIYLEDLDLNIIHDLKSSAYNFTSESGTFNNRFVLRYTNEILSAPNFTSENNIIVYKDKNALKINSSIENIEKVAVYDMLGRKIFEAVDIKNKNFSKENLILTQQTLIVKIKLSDGTMVAKKIIF